jgi:hypothetical protein
LIDVGVTPGALALLEPLADVPPVDPAGELVEVAVGAPLFEELLHAASTVTAPTSAAAIRT